ncbi:hypothetical protein CANARDRAFT_195265 [[Candida] arabinofermentans NRRL YB-2248]|uniref:Concentrative nucleoside transporter C-terminal domain-containing protein n=1 Tax=[Candida] arabinofermentans NRRL YB-2248 TaxID=983967 RepID=A0A1E4T691_9ASCO|nr:hypothetical protein CANARDRAFT_195265 [[Candida] arabinofermentans NRRL YB-2248]
MSSENPITSKKTNEANESIVDLEPKTVAEKQSTFDIETAAALSSEEDETPREKDKLAVYWNKAVSIVFHRYVVHVVVGLLFTAWWISILAQGKHRPKYLIPSFIWAIILIRLITWNTKYHYFVWGYVKKTWRFGVSIRDKLIPQKFRIFAGTCITLMAMLVGSFVPDETPDSLRKDRARSFFGVIVALLALFVTSENRRAINWYTVQSGMLMQFIVAVFVLRTKAGYDFFNFISTLARELLSFAKKGVAFLTTDDISQNTFFFFSVLPAVIFFVAVVHIWYHWGLVQWCIAKGSHFFLFTMECSGAESAVAVASPFIGQGESAILINSLLPFVTRSELHEIMCAGFATISGSVLASYISLGLNPQSLVSSCMMSIPCSLALSKMRVPETERSLSHGRVMTTEDLSKNSKKASNVIEAFSNGAALGLQIALMILTNCLCIIALVALVNGLLYYFGKFWNIHDLSLTLIFGYIFYPVAWLLGVPKSDLLTVSRLIGIKVIQNEYVGFSTLVAEADGMTPRGSLIATFALCGFANLGSVGTQIGVMKTLAPAKSKQISEMVVSALITGCIATLVSACIAGMVINDMSGFEITSS